MENELNREKLKKLINDTTPYYERRRAINQALSIGVGLLGITLSLGATVAGIITEDARISAALGAGAATTQAILFAYPVDKRAGTYRVLTARNKNLWIELEVNKPTEIELRQILTEFQAIQLQAAMEESSPGNLDEAADKLATGTSVHQDDHQSPITTSFIAVDQSVRPIS